MNEHRDNSAHPDEQDDIDYRPFNPLAMLALVLAVFSCFSVATLYLLPLSILAGLLALIAIRQSEGAASLGGGRIAAAALFLAIVTGVTSLTYHMGRDWYLKITARRYSMVVLQELANGRPEHALSYGVDYNYRMPPGTDLKQHYLSVEKRPGEPLEPYRHLQTWLAKSPIREMYYDAMHGDLEFLGYGEHKREPEWEFVNLRYRYTPESPDLELVEFRVEMLRRHYGKPYDVQWRFREFWLDKGPEQGAISIGRPPGAGGAQPKGSPGPAPQ